MHVFISDLHLTDQDVGSPVSDSALASFVRDRLKEARQRNQTLTLIINGDGVDLLRSRKWSTIATENNSFPWSGMGEDFKNFSGGHAENTAIQVLESIRKRYKKFNKVLRDGVDSKSLHVEYIVGNHDYMIQLSKDLRVSLIEFFALERDPDKALDTVYLDDELSVYATHGNCHDEINRHERESGRWAIGDAVVLRIVNRFAELAVEKLGLKDETEIGRLLHELDNVRPHIDGTLFVLWLTKSRLNAKYRDDVMDVWKTVVNDFLDIKLFKGNLYLDNKRDNKITELRMALKLSTKSYIQKLIKHISDLLPEEDDYTRHAEKLASTSNNYRFIVYGHTHIPVFKTLKHTVAGKPCFYVNTGCWRTVWRRPNTHMRGPFSQYFVATWFQIDLSQKERPYEFVQKCLTD